MRQALTDFEDASRLPLDEKKKAKKRARNLYRKARRQTDWLQAVAETRIKKPLILSSFEGSGDRDEWPRLLKAKCEDKHVADEETLSAMRARQLNLWNIAESEDVDEEFWSIKASDVLMARARMNKNRAPGDDGVVTEIVPLLPLCAMYFVARIYDDRFLGRSEMATSWRSIIMRFCKELRPT